MTVDWDDVWEGVSEDVLEDYSCIEAPTLISGAGGDAFKTFGDPLEALHGVNPVNSPYSHDPFLIPPGSLFPAVTTSSQPSSQPRTGFIPYDTRILPLINEDRAMAASSEAAIDKKCDKRPRSQNWSPDETSAYLVLKPSSQPRTGFIPYDTRILPLINEDRAMAASSEAAIDKKCDKRPRSQNWSPDETSAYLVLKPSSQPRTGFIPYDTRILPLINEDRAMAASSEAAIDKKCDKRPRSQNWSPDETSAYLVLKEEALWAVEGVHWDFISQGLRIRYRFDRSAKCCEDHWGFLRKAHFAILEHEHSSTGDLQTSNRVSFWQMGEDERSLMKLPLVFPSEWYEAMERILFVQEITKRSKKKSRGIPPQYFLDDSQYSSGRVQDSFAEPKEDDEYSHQQPQLPNFEKEHVDDPVEAAVEGVIDSLLERRRNRKKRGATSEPEDDLISRLRPLIKQKMEYAINDDAVMSMLAPMCKPDIEESLERKLEVLLGPVASVLQKVERKQREGLLALEMKLALQRKKIQRLKRRRAGRFRRTSSWKASRPRTRHCQRPKFPPAM